MGPPLNGKCTKISPTLGGGDINSKEFTKVIGKSEGPVYTGNRALRMQIPYNCDYNQVNSGPLGDIGGPLDKARTGFATTGLDLPSDQYVWMAWGMYIPDNWEVEKNQVTTHLFQVPMGPAGAPGPLEIGIVKGSTMEIVVRSQN